MLKVDPIVWGRVPRPSPERNATAGSPGQLAIFSLQALHFPGVLTQERR
jgi:hypothetical protein